MIDDIRFKWFLTDIEARVLLVAFELSDDPNYSREDAIKDLEKVAQILKESS